MPLNFNVQPYYDDFDPSKNFHRVLFKPGYAVQARELTQSQTILQDQITKFADNIFKQNSPVTGGQVTTNLKCHYIKLQPTYNDVPIDLVSFLGRNIQNTTGTILAKVIAISEATTDDKGNIIDPDTLIVSYKTGTHFGNNQDIFDSLSNNAAKSIVTNATGSSSVASIAQGVFYISSNYKRPDGIKLNFGTFVQVNPQTIILSKYSSTPSVRVGLNIFETINDYIDDASLLDPAIGASNYQAPGADRYVIRLLLETRPLTLGDDDGFIELVRITNGNMAKMVDGSVYSVIGDYFAKRDYETNGDYIINDFKLTPKSNPNNPDTYILNVGTGLSYVHGYRFENPSDLPLVSNRSRETDNQNNRNVYLDYGSYFYVDNVKGNTATFFDISNLQLVDFHCVDTANVVTTSAATYNSTLVGTGYIRGLDFVTSTSDTDTSTYVYKSHVHDIQLTTLSYSQTITNQTNTITIDSSIASTKNDAYVGVDITINDGTSSFFNTITAYNSGTRVATLKTPWSLSKSSATYTVTLNFNIKNIDNIIAVSKTSWPATITSSSSINIASRSGNLLSGSTVLQNPKIPEMIYRIGNPFVSDLTDTTYQTFRVFKGSEFRSNGGSGVSCAISLSGTPFQHLGSASTTLTSDRIKENFIIIVTDKLSNSSLTNGSILPWTNNSIRTISIGADGSTITLLSSDLTDFNATIIEKVSVNNAGNESVLKKKNLIKANTSVINISGTTVNTYTKVDNTDLTSTGQVYIQKNGVLSYGNKQSLYLSDVKRIVKIIDTKSAGTVPTVAMLSDASYDVTNRYTFDNGQRDNFYDHASISLKPGVTKPTGNILVLLDYYQHVGGDGYFSIKSYLTSHFPENYNEIPSYRSKLGNTYLLRDCIDFRPVRVNAVVGFTYKTTNGALLPLDLSSFLCDYSYYLARNDLLVITKNQSLKILEGSPSLTPTWPTPPNGALTIAKISHLPYTSYLPSERTPASLSISKVQHKRYTMQDISELESRINTIEYYTSLSLLEQSASSSQIKDGMGLNRFKNGIMTDDFANAKTSDGTNYDFNASVDTLNKILTSGKYVYNFPLKSLATIYNKGELPSSSINNLGFVINKDGNNQFYSLPYSTDLLVKQPIASRTTNINPFSVTNAEGVLHLSPNSDNWVDNTQLPALLIVDPDLKIWKADPNVNTVMQTGDWKTISSSTKIGSQSTSTSNKVLSQSVNHTDQDWSFGVGIGVQVNEVTTTTSTTYVTTTQQSATDIRGAYSALGNTYEQNNGYLTDVSILPWMRQQEVVVRCSGMLAHTPISTYFDDKNVDVYIRKPNILELTNTGGIFDSGSIIGYKSNNIYYPIGVVLDTYNYGNNNLKKIRLYVVGETNNTSYNTNTIIYELKIDESGVISEGDGYGTLTSISHYGGKVVGVTNNLVTLPSKASSVNDYYKNWSFTINSGKGAGSSSIITAYNGTTKVATLSTAISTTAGAIYSLSNPEESPKPFITNESGHFCGVFLLPGGIFHTGEKKFTIDNRTNSNDKSTATTSAESSYYASGLSKQSQEIDFATTPAGAKGTFEQTRSQTLVSSYTDTTISKYRYKTPYDPVAQTFMIEASNYPNGVYLSSINIFLSNKPDTENDTITLSIVGTLNGYPNGKTLDHSIVTLTKDKVNTSYDPHYLDPTSYTTFKFNVPVYIRPGVLYAFILQSSSNEYLLWTAANGDNAVSSTIKNLPSDPTPPKLTKITTAPYVGSLFISQNTQTWTADQNQSLMFTINHCVFNTSTSPVIEFVVPKNLPQRTLIEDGIQYLIDPDSILDSPTATHTTPNNVIVDAFNTTTTDFIPTGSSITYSYKSTLYSDNSVVPARNITPGRYASAMYDDILLDDGKGERVLKPSSDTSFSLLAKLSSSDKFISPMISDAGLSVFAIKNHINNCELSNNLITIIDGGSGYNINTTTVSVSSPIGSYGSTAQAKVNIVNGEITSVYFTNNGSGYITTPTITITDPTTRSGNSNVSISVLGETSSHGGSAYTRYITKKVVLAEGLDAGDLRVYLTAYRPVNTDVHVYYKILNANDTQSINECNWQLMTKINNSSTLYSKTRNDIFEFEFAPGIFNSNLDQGFVQYTSNNGQVFKEFNQFVIKIVLTSKDATYVPEITDMRCIALPSLTETVF